MGVISEKIHSSLPGDEILPFPRKTITHAVTINAPSERIWPWLVQLGSGRAGWYSYDLIDNGGTPSASRIIPELQHIQVGDILPAVPDTKDSFIVREIHPGKAIVLVVPVKTAMEDPNTWRRMKGPLRVSWTLFLETLEEGGTKLISRGHISKDWLIPSPAAMDSSKRPIFIERIYSFLAKMPWPLMAPIAITGHYLMESRMLHGIKRRAETQTDASSLN